MAKHKKWKTEHWSTELKNAKATYQKLNIRELVIIMAAEIDAILAEAISLRIPDPDDEMISFLGVDQSGMSPCGSFSSRIQLAVLLRIITPSDAAMIREVKALRNQMSHRVTVSLTEPKLKSHVEKILKLLYEFDTVSKDTRSGAEQAISKLMKNEEEMCNALKVTMFVMRIAFTRLMKRITPIEPIGHKGFAKEFDEAMGLGSNLLIPISQAVETVKNPNKRQ